VKIEEVESRIDQGVSVLHDGKVVARGMLRGFAVISAPTAPSGGAGWRLDQFFVLNIDGEPHRVSFGAKLLPHE